MWFIGYEFRCQSDELGPGDFPMEFGSLIEGALIAFVIHIARDTPRRFISEFIASLVSYTGMHRAGY